MALKFQNLSAYPHGTKTYVIHKNQIVIGVVKKREINEFDYVNYGLKVPDRKTLIWINEDRMTDNLDDVVLHLKKDLEQTLKQ